ncbi:MAG: nucleotide exchange factor GrpE [Alphaproteobacteria bacterium]|jgi:molecular chaperone GrpE|uniref:nucleotide exchange factor GrpE n=1 Tax=unclassified Agrobacterium TaxID=2632611 RepID=UPI00083E6160|nr:MULTISPECIES: nucleotide exchange factor GrpE [unclassified Agrobacterium]MBU0739661.1 nucleotide exchange factor GrpE [Alphaproteobacteria bacterium]AOG10814.1 grpE family protein [Agrobacterium sp. RAC06]MBU0834979.1 nucleotide exchange factor GrpE [Alphaproteobacteria bacterium]MBU1763424.1 nucleotide exchange factor GrpE [Alphaproteobacteria bacterium]QGG88963.1 nucleotide exchange factor GrpE [Agrobacterium sp. MA01]
MTEETNKNGPDAAATEAEATAATEEGQVANESEAGSAQENDPIDALKAENADLRDRFLRLAAEMDNLRRRTDREIKDAKSYAVTGFARDMLSVSDNLRRAIETLPDEARAAADATVTALIEGVEMTERGMLATLERHGVRKIEAEGQKFDPNFHQAMFEVPNPNVPNNTVVQVVQAGYAIGERVLRPAMVGVAKGGPKEAAAEDAAKA